MSFFSVIIPTYNRADIISPTIKSVIDQKFKDWELILIDDGGNDKTEEVVNGFNDDRIKYYWKENGERGAARNYGVGKSSGEYVFYLDSDDLIYSNHLEHAFIELTNLNKPEFFHSRYEEVTPSAKKVVKSIHKNKIWDIIQKQNQFACQFFLRKDIALKFPFSEDRNLKIGEDWLVILKVGLMYKLNISNQVTAALIQHENRSMEVAKTDDVLYSRDMIIKELASIENAKKAGLISKVNYELTSLASLSAVLNGEKINSLLILLKLFARFPIRMITERRTLAIIKHLLT